MPTVPMSAEATVPISTTSGLLVNTSRRHRGLFEEVTRSSLKAGQLYGSRLFPVCLRPDVVCFALRSTHLLAICNPTVTGLC